MTRWGCPAGGELYALRLLAGCPRHPSTALVEEDHMPKITRHGGPSNAAADTEGGEQPSPGTNSSTSPKTEPSPPESNENADPPPAQTTASRSRRRRTAQGGSADSTATSGPETDGEPSASPADRKSAGGGS